MAKRINLDLFIGKTFERLTILSEGEPHFTSGGYKHRTIICKCSCGIEKSFQMSSVFNGLIKSCGCYSADTASKRMRIENRVHGGAGTPEYNVYLSMIKRCTKEYHKSFQKYGGRGITVCDRWLNSFENFISDMGERPCEGYSLDRIDNDKGYSPENCRWTDKVTQQRNKGNNVVVTYNGRTKCLAEWAEITGLSWQALFYRIFTAKWDLEKVFNTPVE